MVTKALKDAIERAEHWPEERQNAAAQILREIDEQSAARYTLTDEQVAEVERILSEPNPEYLTLDEVRARLARWRA